MAKRGPKKTAKTNTLERFWNAVAERDNGCWEWTKGTIFGYGRFVLACGIYIRAHRFSWLLATKEPIPDGLCVLHKCDNPRCVNPDHLFLGTNADNMADKKNKGRAKLLAKRGADHHAAKFTWEQAIAIRYDTRPNIELAALYGATANNIHMIKTGQTYIAPLDSAPPPRITDGHAHELALGMSKTVIVKVLDCQSYALGRYIHAAQEWQVDNFSGYCQVVEWWPLPKEGTGTPCGNEGIAP